MGARSIGIVRAVALLAVVGLGAAASAQPPGWSVNPHDYAYNGSVTAAVFAGGTQVGTEGDVLAAFVGEECRGIAEAWESPWGTYMFLLMVYGNAPAGDVLAFQYYDSGEDAVSLVQETRDFVPNMTECGLLSPCELHVLLPNSLPIVPANPQPVNGAEGVPATTELCWSGGDPDAGDEVAYHVYLDTEPLPSHIETTDFSDAASICYEPSTPLLDETLYYWTVVAEDEHGATMGTEIWTFRTGDSPVNESTWGAVKALYRN
jgi:hypothetical protein